MKEEKKQNFRMSTRVFVKYPAYFASGDAEYIGDVLQISEGGLIFRCAERIRMGATGGLSIKVFDAEPDVYLKGTVIYELPEMVNRKSAWKYGLRFIDVDNKRRDVISRVIMYSSLRDRYTPHSTGVIVGSDDSNK